MRRSYMVEILFNLLLFALFVFCSFIIVVSGARGYERIVDAASNSDENRIVLSYLAIKVRQAPSREAITIEKGDGVNCLLIREGYYQTLIYYSDQALYELYAREDAGLALSDAEMIVEVHDLKMDKKGDVFHFAATNGASETESLSVAYR